MRQLIPAFRDIEPDDLSELYGRGPALRLNMISSVDGGATVGGVSGGLGGAADKLVFAALRTMTDAVLVGAGTVRAERYGPVRLPAEARARRRAGGMTEVPPIAVVTSTAQLDWSRPFFTEADVRPIIVTGTAAPADSMSRAREVADVIVAGDTRVDPADAAAALHAEGFAHILAEGGPRLGAELAAAGILDELCVTLSPKLIAGDGPRILVGPAFPSPIDLEVVHLLEEDGYVFLRYRKAETRG
jgi:riboflavin biosynthesis pyrimidine reductase